MACVRAIYSADMRFGLKIPLVSGLIRAGFPSPADDVGEQPLDLNAYIVTHPAATFYVRVDGDSMIGAGIYPGDLLVVDRSLKAKSGDVVVAVHQGEFTVKRLCIKQDSIMLLPENANYDPIEVRSEDDFEVWGVVSYVVHKP